MYSCWHWPHHPRYRNDAFRASDTVVHARHNAPGSIQGRSCGTRRAWHVRAALRAGPRGRRLRYSLARNHPPFRVCGDTRREQETALTD
jgi:hypothetical protein